METKTSSHPSELHLAALALGKLRGGAVEKVRSHVDACDSCASFLRDTPREQLTATLRAAQGAASALQNTHIAGDSGTMPGPASAILRDAGTANVARSQFPESPPESIPDDLRTQTKYRVIRLLGRGGMGSVYEAEHIRMQRKVAIKIINPELVNHPQALERFEKETRACSAVDHPNIVRAFDAEAFGSLQAIVMEFVPGQTLAELMRVRGGRLSVVEACRCVRQALVGLQHAHERGLVHRDLKPQNLIITRDSGVVKILDFGLGKAVSENRQSRGGTQTNATMGTYEYMAPEQALDAAKADIRADIYSLGCTLYYLIAGALPFDYESYAQLLLAHQSETPVPLAQFCPGTPKPLSALVARMLAKNPADRPQTPREAAEALTPFAKGEAPATAPVRKPLSPEAKWLRKWGAAVAASLVAILLGAWAAGLLSIKTSYGTIVVDNVPADAEVTVDGEQVTVVRDGNSLEIEAVAQGPHRLRVVQDGHEVWSSDLTVSFGGEQVRLSFAPAPAAVASDGAGSSSRVATIVEGTPWQTEEDELIHVGGNGEQWLLFGDPSWRDYEFTYEMSHNNRGDCLSTFILSPDDRHWVQWGMGWLGDKAILEHRREEQRHIAIEEPKPGPRTYPNTWHKVRTVVRGNSLQGFLDDELIWERADLPHDHGRVGLRTWTRAADFVVRYRNLKVTGLDGKVLWEGLPQMAAPGADSTSSATPERQSASTNSDAGLVPTATALFPNAEVESGAWAIDGDELVQQTAQDKQFHAVSFGDPAWTKYTLTFRAMSERGSQGFQARAHVGEGAHVQFAVGGSYNTLHHLGVFQNGSYTRNEGMSSRGKVEFHRWYTVKLDVDGPHVRCVLDGQLLFDSQFPGFTHGRVGLATWDTAARFRDIEVRLADGTVVWRGLPVLPGTPRKISTDSAESTAGAETSDEGFAPLFNGRDLTGWKTHPGQPGEWSVVDGRLVATGAAVSHLYTERDDYSDVHVRVRMRMSEGARGGLYVRSAYGPKYAGTWLSGLETVLSATGGDGQIAGSIFANASRVKDFGSRPLEANKSFRLEVIMLGNVVTVLVDGKEAARYSDAARSVAPRGHISLLFQHGPIEFESIEVKELGVGRPGVATQSEVANTPATHHDSFEQPVDLMPLVRLPGDAQWGSWQKSGDGYQSDATGGARIVFPFSADGEFDYRVSFTRIEGDGMVTLKFHYGTVQCFWYMGSRQNVGCGLAHRKGRSIAWAGTRRSDQSPRFANGKRYEAVLKVRRNEVRGYIDGELISTWRVDHGDLGIPEDAPLGPRELSIMSQMPTVFHEAEVIPATSQLSSAPARAEAAPMHGPAVSHAALKVIGSWSIVGDELVSGPDPPKRCIYFGDPAWADYNFSYEFCCDKAQSSPFGLIRYAGDNHVHFGMSLFKGDNTTELGFFMNGRWENNPNRRERREQIEANRWYKIDLEGRGSTFVASMDGKEYFRTSRDGFSHGSVGFMVQKNGAVRFRNISVTAPDGTILWQGLPELSANPAAKLPSSETTVSNNTLSDLLVIRSVWEGEKSNAANSVSPNGTSGSMQLKVDHRAGNSVGGEIVLSGTRRYQFQGQVESNGITISTERIGSFEHEFWGELDGDLLRLEFTGASVAGAEAKGVATLRRIEPTP